MKLDIIILIRNQLEVTKICFQSIAEYTNAEYNLIVIDNASKDGSEKWIRKFCKKNDISLRYAKNKHNRGVSKGWNQGLKLSTSEYIAILNNDIIVTPNWETNLMLTLYHFPKILIAYPNSIQDNLTVDNITQRLSFMYCLEETDFFAGYCFMMKRKCLAEIGYFDEQFTPFLCEDTDYAYRLILNKTLPIKVYSSFVIHLKSKTLRTVNYTKIQDRNKQKLKDKYEKHIKNGSLNIDRIEQSIANIINTQLRTLTKSIRVFADIAKEFINDDTQDIIQIEEEKKENIIEIIQYKLINPINFISTPHMKHGSTIFVDDIPEWAVNNSAVVIEKIKKNINANLDKKEASS